MSATRSETFPPRTCAGRVQPRGLPDPRSTTPSASSAASAGALPDTGNMRATGAPRSVIKRASPARMRRRYPAKPSRRSRTDTCSTKLTSCVHIVASAYARHTTSIHSPANCGSIARKPRRPAREQCGNTRRIRGSRQRSGRSDPSISTNLSPRARSSSATSSRSSTAGSQTLPFTRGSPASASTDKSGWSGSTMLSSRDEVLVTIVRRLGYVSRVGLERNYFRFERTALRALARPTERGHLKRTIRQGPAIYHVERREAQAEHTGRPCPTRSSSSDQSDGSSRFPWSGRARRRTPYACAATGSCGSRWSTEATARH